MNRLGFTGTQIGMTQAQRITFAMCLATLDPASLAHGDCTGADEQAHEMAITARLRVYIHPPTDSSKRAWCEGAAFVFAPEEYLVRNRSIVDCCDVLIATPKRPIEELRSGTWATVRYARRQRGTNRKNIIVINPDGTTT
jgi:hypothetical protein